MAGDGERGGRKVQLAIISVGPLIARPPRIGVTAITGRPWRAAPRASRGRRGSGRRSDKGRGHRMTAPGLPCERGKRPGATAAVAAPSKASDCTSGAQRGARSSPGRRARPPRSRRACAPVIGHRQEAGVDPQARRHDAITALGVPRPSGAACAPREAPGPGPSGTRSARRATPGSAGSSSSHRAAPSRARGWQDLPVCRARVEVRADQEAEGLEVIARVDDQRETVRWQHAVEPEREAGTADAACDRRDLRRAHGTGPRQADG